MRKERLELKISGMTCSQCEERISRAVRALPGVLSVTASFPKKQVTVHYNADLLQEQKIRDAIEKTGYLVRPDHRSASGSLQKDNRTLQKDHPVFRVLPLFSLAIAAYLFLRMLSGFDILNQIPQIDQTVSLLALFTTGLLTSVHCIAMCGGINLSQSVCLTGGEQSGRHPAGSLRAPLLYNLGRVVSYTVLGGLIGGLGSVLSISLAVKGALMLAAAVFMALMGLSMLGWLPAVLVPRLPAGLRKMTAGARSGKGPFVVGLLNGLMPCGPLQAMQVYALSTGSVLYGALSMMLFAAGTVPLMLGAGAIFAMLKGRFSRAIARVSAVLIILMAFVMLSNAASLFGWNLPGAVSGTGAPGSTTALSQPASGTPLPSDESVLKDGSYQATLMDGYQVVTVDLKGSRYPTIKVQTGIPVLFNLRAEKRVLTGCNNAIAIPRFKLEQKLQPGDNVIRFTPDKAGTIPYTCWMGMIPGKILVVDQLTA